MKFESGAMGYHFGTWGARGSEHGYCYQLHMTEGMIDYHKYRGEIWLYQNHEPDLGIDMTPPTPKNTHLLWKKEDTSYMTNTLYEMRHFVACVRDGKKPVTDGWAALQSLRCIWKMYEAEELGKVADLHGLGLPK